MQEESFMQKVQKYRNTTQSSALRILHRTWNALFCGKTRHTAENCRAQKKAEKKARSQESKSTRSNMSNPLTTATGQTQGCPASALSLTRPQMPRTSSFTVGTPTDNRPKASTTGNVSWWSHHVTHVERNTTPSIPRKRRNGSKSSLLYGRLHSLHPYLSPRYVWLYKHSRSPVNFFKLITRVTHVTA